MSSKSEMEDLNNTSKNKDTPVNLNSSSSDPSDATSNSSSDDESNAQIQKPARFTIAIVVVACVLVALLFAGFKAFPKLSNSSTTKENVENSNDILPFASEELVGYCNLIALEPQPSDYASIRSVWRNFPLGKCGYWLLWFLGCCGFNRNWLPQVGSHRYLEIVTSQRNLETDELEKCLMTVGLLSRKDPDSRVRKNYIQIPDAFQFYFTKQMIKSVNAELKEATNPANNNYISMEVEAYWHDGHLKYGHPNSTFVSAVQGRIATTQDHAETLGASSSLPSASSISRETHDEMLLSHLYRHYIHYDIGTKQEEIQSYAYGEKPFLFKDGRMAFRGQVFREFRLSEKQAMGLEKSRLDFLLTEIGENPTMYYFDRSRVGDYGFEFLEEEVQEEVEDDDLSSKNEQFLESRGTVAGDHDHDRDHSSSGNGNGHHDQSQDQSVKRVRLVHKVGDVGSGVAEPQDGYVSYKKQVDDGCEKINELLQGPEDSASIKADPYAFRRYLAGDAQEEIFSKYKGPSIWRCDEDDDQNPGGPPAAEQNDPVNSQSDAEEDSSREQFEAARKDLQKWLVEQMSNESEVPMIAAWRGELKHVKFDMILGKLCPKNTGYDNCQTVMKVFEELGD